MEGSNKNYLCNFDYYRTKTTYFNFYKQLFRFLQNIFCLSYSITLFGNFGYLDCKAKIWNKYIKATNGNIKAPSLRIIHWNKGSSKFSNKLDDINIINDKFRPHIFSILEANYDLVEKISLDNYSIETDNMQCGNKLSRTIMLINKQLNYTRLGQYDTPGISSVCIKLLLKSKNNPVFLSFYRQWQLSSDSQVKNPSLYDNHYRYSNIIDMKKKIY